MTPLYARVKTYIVEQIRSGALKAGSRVPSENELVESFGISRMTANRALNELTTEGMLARVPGVGTFVKEATPRSSLLELRNIADEIGLNVRTFYRMFKENIGISPVGFKKIARFRHSLSDKFFNEQFQRLTDIAYNSNFYDQPYFINIYTTHLQYWNIVHLKFIIIIMISAFPV